MKKIFILAVLLAGALILPASENPTVLIKTERGDITVEIFADKAPLTAANFLAYVDARLYDGTVFHRTVALTSRRNNPVPIEVIQGGQIDPAKSRPAIPLERTNVTGIRHLDGVISMARSSADTAASSFFFCLGDQLELDYGGKRNADGQGFAAFGKVVAGMEVVREIHRCPADENELLTPPIKILSVSRIVE